MDAGNEAQNPLAAGVGGRRPAWSVFRDALERAGFRPTKTRGQNFLIDPNVHAAIVRDAEVQAGDRVLEVGAGCGFLSCHLAEAGVELLSVEIDPRLAAICQRFLAPYPKVQMWIGDALAGKHALAPGLLWLLEAFQPFHLVANLPYSISAPLVSVLSRLPEPPLSMSVLVQREVAHRLTAQPGERSFGALAARLALRYETRLGREVGPRLFWPRPRVDSAMAHLKRRSESIEPERLERIERVIEGVFRHPRRQLPGALEGVFGSKARAQEVLEGLKIESQKRPMELTLEELTQLAQHLF